METVVLTNRTLNRPLAIIDLETTGKNTDRDWIVEICIAKIFPDGTKDIRTRRLNPGIPIPAEATVVHGITDADVANEPPFAKLAKGLNEFLMGCDLGGFNLIGFDLVLLAAEFHRVGQDCSLANRKVIDVMKIYHQREQRNLEAAVKFYLNRDHSNAQSAEADVIASGEILNSMVARYNDLPRNFDKLYELVRDPNQLDISGKFFAINNEPHFTFGKHSGKPLAWVAQQDPSYLRWPLNQSFLNDTKEIILRYLSP